MCNHCKKPKLNLLEKSILAFIVIAIMMFAFARLSHAQRIVAPDFVSNAYDLQMWLRGNFTYQKDVTPEDEWKQVPQTLQDNGGDCEDFAVLTSKIFTEILIWNQIVVISFSDQSVGHAITVFKETDDTLSYFDNQYYRNVHAANLEELLTQEYPNWSFAQITNNYGRVKQNIYRIKDQMPTETDLLLIIDDLNERLYKLEQDKEEND